jgi:hypothetical protein
MANVQFNITLDESDAVKVKQDALAMGVTLGTYSAQAFEMFLSKPAKARRSFFESAKLKRKSGRKIAA